MPLKRSQRDELIDRLKQTENYRKTLTHLLPHAIEECQSYLLDAMPWLKEIDTSGLNEENYEEWMDEMIKKYGEYHDVSPIPSNTTDHT